MHQLPAAPRYTQVNGPVLRLARLAARLTLRQLASTAGMHHTQLSRIERGLLGQVRPEVFAALVAATGCDPELVKHAPRSGLNAA